MRSPIPARTFLEMQAVVKKVLASILPHPVRGVRALMGANLIPYRGYWRDHEAILGHIIAVAEGQASERKPYQGYVHGQGPVLAQEIGGLTWPRLCLARPGNITLAEAPGPALTLGMFGSTTASEPRKASRRKRRVFDMREPKDRLKNKQDLNSS